MDAVLGQPVHDVEGRIEPPAHVEGEGDLVAIARAVTDDDCPGPGRRRDRRRLAGCGGRRRPGRRRERRLIGQGLGVDDRPGDEDELPADLDPVGRVALGLGVEARVGCPVPVGDAPRRRLERSRDRGEVVAGHDDVGPERRHRSRRRRNERWFGRRAAGRRAAWRRRPRARRPAGADGVRAGRPPRRAREAGEARRAGGVDRSWCPTVTATRRPRLRRGNGSVSVAQRNGRRIDRGRLLERELAGERETFVGGRDQAVAAPLGDEAGAVSGKQDRLRREAVARERRQADRDADRDLLLGPPRARSADGLDGGPDALGDRDRRARVGARPG